MVALWAGLCSLLRLWGMLPAQMLLRRLNGESAPDYLAVLVSMELSLHNLEVVSRIIASLDIPQDFINNYIAGCIAACDRAEVRPLMTLNSRP